MQLVKHTGHVVGQGILGFFRINPRAICMSSGHMHALQGGLEMCYVMS